MNQIVSLEAYTMAEDNIQYNQVSTALKTPLILDLVLVISLDNRSRCLFKSS